MDPALAALQEAFAATVRPPVPEIGLEGGGEMEEVTPGTPENSNTYGFPGLRRDSLLSHSPDPPARDHGPQCGSI